FTLPDPFDKRLEPSVLEDVLRDVVLNRSPGHSGFAAVALRTSLRTWPHILHGLTPPRCAGCCGSGRQTCRMRRFGAERSPLGPEGPGFKSRRADLPKNQLCAGLALVR